LRVGWAVVYNLPMDSWRRHLGDVESAIGQLIDALHVEAEGGNEPAHRSLPWAEDARERLKAVRARMDTKDPALADVIDAIAEARRRER
jgi:hypothetical protein